VAPGGPAAQRVRAAVRAVRQESGARWPDPSAGTHTSPHGPTWTSAHEHTILAGLNAMKPPAPNSSHQPETPGPAAGGPGSSAAGGSDAGPNFIAEIIEADLAAQYPGGRLQTRFPPEPNGFLHVGHAKAICLNFKMAEKLPQGRCNLRLDDTNPEAEDELFVRSIQEDVRWLGFDPEDRVYFASDYFEQLYAFASRLVDRGLAYVDSQSAEEIKENRGNYHRVGTDSPFRGRSPAENRDLLTRMRAGEFDEGACVLRAKTAMDHKNVLMRDPLIYRIKKATHHRTRDSWCIYPMYDFAHPLCDAIEGVTHSLCTLEFESHRPLYDWFIANVGGFDPVPRQIEFARLNLGYTVLSKRKLTQLVNEGHVSGWDDPRMPSIAGMRRRGYLPESLRTFCDRIGVAKRDGVVDVSLLEHRIREDLNAHADRSMAVLDPLKIVLVNFPASEAMRFDVPVHPEDSARGTRSVTLTREIYVEQDDFMEVPAKKWFRLAAGQEVRLRGACIIRCQEAHRDATGRITELACTWDPDSKGGSPADGRKIKGTIHWISAADAVSAEVRLYDRLFSVEDPDGQEGTTFLEHLNPGSLTVRTQALIHREVAERAPLERLQFERLGYFCIDADSRVERPVLNRTIGLKDSWAKIADRES
jgi:glutaminyl-tRNA synthetase